MTKQKQVKLEATVSKYLARRVDESCDLRGISLNEFATLAFEAELLRILNQEEIENGRNQEPEK